MEQLFSSERIAARVAELGREIGRTLPVGGELVAICVLKGSFAFYADLVRAIPREMTCEFLTARSYGEATISSGTVEVGGTTAPVTGKHVLLIEDIVDTGRTLDYLMKMLAAGSPASLHVATLLSKPSRREIDVRVDFIGFEVPDRFIVGCGLDYAQNYRNLPYLAVLPDPPTP